MVEAASSLAGLDLASDQADGCEYEQQRTFRPTADLNGDGFDEVLRYSPPPFWCDTRKTTVTALSGDNGAELWSRTFPGFAVLIPAGKVDTSPGGDLIVWEIQEESPADNQWILTYTAISGRDASTLWVRSHATPHVGTGLTGVSGSLFLDFALPLGLAEATGDGVQDLLIGRYQAAFLEEELVTDLDEERFVGAFDVVSGASGVTTSSSPGTGNRVFPDATFIPDWNGDGLSDVAVLSVTGTPGNGFAVGVRVEAYSGSGGRPLWAYGSTQPDVPTLDGAEFSGDGRGDVILTALDESHGIFSELTHITVISANSEVQVTSWRSVVDGEGFAQAVPDVSGDGGKEIMAIMEQDGRMFAHLLRGSGLSPGSPAPFTLWEIEEWTVQLAGDATGDGAEDLLVTDYNFNQSTSEWYDTTSIVSGRQGTTVWSRDHNSGNSYDFFVPTRVDGNANGTADVAFVSFLYSSDAYELVDGSSGSPLWASAQAIGGAYSQLFHGHFSGMGDDILERVAVWEGSSFSHVEYHVRAGENGAVLWTALDRP